MSNCVVVDLLDLTEKYRSFVDFLTHSCSRQLYQDDFLVFVKPLEGTNQCNLTFRWYCSAFETAKVSNIMDSRHHEKLLSKYFKKFNLLIEKDTFSWNVIVSTPVNQSSVLSVALPCTKD
jgi:hypothetical protein